MRRCYWRRRGVMNLCYTRARTYTHIRVETSKSGKKIWDPIVCSCSFSQVVSMGYNCVATVYGMSGTVLQNYKAVPTLSAPNYLVKISLHFPLTCLFKHTQYTPIPCLHATLNITPISDFIFHLTDKFFGSCPAHPNPLIRSIGNHSLADLHRQYKKYIHKQPKYILL